MAMPQVLHERKIVFFVVQTSRYFGSCRILPYPAVSCQNKLYTAVSAIYCRILVSLPYPAYPAVSCHFLPYPAVSSRIPPYPAVSCHILPYPAVSNTRNRETLLVTLMSLNEPDAKALDLQDMPIMAECDPDAMLWQEQALRGCTATLNLTPSSQDQGTNTIPPGLQAYPYPTKVRSKSMSTDT